MNILRKFSTAIRILSDGGIGALMDTAGRNFSALLASNSPDESAIAFEALQANTYAGHMIDVGAHSGSSLSSFAQRGWQIIAFEPDSENRSLLETTFGDLPNVIIDRRAVSDRAKGKAVLYRSEESTGISGLSSFHSTHQPGEEVEVTTLEHAIDELGFSDQDIDYLKIDTEGFDLLVLKGFPWSRTAPRLILCEFEDSKTVPLGYTFHDMANFLVLKGYHLIVSEWYPIKRYGKNHNWRRFTKYPCELEDTQAWGNILATKEDVLYQNLLRLCNITANK